MSKDSQDYRQLDYRHLPLQCSRTRPQFQPAPRPRALLLANCCKSWAPLILYALTSALFILAIALWKDEVFTLLDELAHFLRADPHFGHALLFVLIFLTTIPPIPLYSTLITLSGYTFGPWTGAVISYGAALTGALAVFVLSRLFLRETIARWLAATTTIKRVVRAIDRRPKLLFLIRLAPYPYNVMNALLAASPTLSLRTYTLCTALSLFKVIIHTALGASIHSFKEYHADEEEDTYTAIDDDTDAWSAQSVARLWTVLGIALCVLILVYLTIVASRAVDDELEDVPSDDEERVAFLQVDDADAEPNPMAESPFRTHNLVPRDGTG